MSTESAYQAVEVLVSAFPGFDDRSIDTYARVLAPCDEHADLMAAAADVVRTFDRPGRPPVAVVLEAYRARRRRTIMNRPALPASGGPVVPPSKGREIAARAYLHECGLRGKEPNMARFDAIVGEIGG